MKKLFFILISAIFLSSSTAFGYEEEDYRQVCENQKNNLQINFYTSYGKLIYDRSLNKEDLSKIAQQAGIFEKGVFAAGLALVNINSEYELNTITKTMKNNAHCLLPYQLNLYIGYSRPIIYLAKDLVEGSCTYNLVLRHEQVHQQINKQALEYFIPKIYHIIKQQSSIIKPIYIPSQASEEKANQSLTQAYHNLITPLVDEFRDQILAEQSKLDNQQHYQLEGDICRYFNGKSR